MSFAPTPADISVIITAASSGSSSEPSFVNERRITPTWTLHQLKSKLETMTGVPPSAASLKLRNPGQDPVWMSGDERRVEEWGIFKGSEIEVHDSRPKSLQPNFTDLSSVEKYELPTSTYESLPNSVLAWKKNQKLGRFDPNALSPAEALKNQVEKDRFDISSRGIQISSRAIILPSTPPHIRRGVIRFIGPVPSIPLTGPARDLEKNGEEIPVENLPVWVGIELDEPTGKNDGSIAGKRYFECGEKRGAFVKPDKIEVGDFPPLSLEDEFDDLEEI